jgi:hypothetical protein
MSKKLHSGLYSTHMAHLITDRKFSRIPLAARLKIPRSSKILKENRLFNTIEDGIKVIQGREELMRYVRNLFCKT